MPSYRATYTIDKPGQPQERGTIRNWTTGATLPEAKAAITDSLAKAFVAETSQVRVNVWEEK